MVITLIYLLGYNIELNDVFNISNYKCESNLTRIEFESFQSEVEFSEEPILFFVLVIFIFRMNFFFKIKYEIFPCPPYFINNIN